MKKIIMSLGFAAATIFAAQAQETNPQEDQQQYPTEETQPQEDVQPQEQTLPQQDMPMEEMDTTQQSVPMEEDMQTNPTQDPTQGDDMQEQDPAEEVTPPVEDPMQETTPPTEDPMQDPADPTQETLPPTEEDMQTPPTQDPTEGVTPPTDDPMQETTPPTEDPMQETTPPAQESDPAMQEEPGMSSESAQQPIEGEGITSIEASALPQEVTDGLENSDFKGATINNAYEVTGSALDQALGQESVEMYAGDQAPEKLYQLQVTHQDKSAVLYFTEEGELYASKEME